MTPTTRVKQVEQVQEIRNLCRLMMEQHEDILRIISDKIDALEVGLTVAYAEETDGIKPLNAISSDGCYKVKNEAAASSGKGRNHAK